MSRKDLFHSAVIRALEKDGWAITHDPLVFDFAESYVGVDLGAEKPFAPEPQNRLIAVEVKSFSGVSPISEFERALGQFLSYRHLLNRDTPNRTLYLAVPVATYRTFFQTQDIQDLCAIHALTILVYDPALEEIVQWIE